MWCPYLHLSRICKLAAILNKSRRMPIPLILTFVSRGFSYLLVFCHIKAVTFIGCWFKNLFNDTYEMLKLVKYSVHFISSLLNTQLVRQDATAKWYLNGFSSWRCRFRLSGWPFNYHAALLDKFFTHDCLVLMGSRLIYVYWLLHKKLDVIDTNSCCLTIGTYFLYKRILSVQTSWSIYVDIDVATNVSPGPWYFQPHPPAA